MSTLFVGLQGAALYRAKIKYLSHEEIVYKVREEKVVDDRILFEWSAPDRTNEPLTNVDEKDPAMVTQEIFNEQENLKSEMDEKWIELEQEEVTTTQEPAQIIPENVSDIEVYAYNDKKPKQEETSVDNLYKYLKSETEKNKPIATVPEISTLSEAEVTFMPILPLQNYDSHQLDIRPIVGDAAVDIDKEGIGYIKKRISHEGMSEMFIATASDMMPTYVTAFWNSKEIDEVEVPFITQAQMSDWYQHFGLNGELGHVLVKLKQGIEHYDLESANHLVFLDNELEEVEQDVASYVLYVGVTPGNKELRIQTESATHFISLHVIQDGVLSMDPVFKAGKKINFGLFEELLLSKVPNDLLLPIEKLKYETGEGYLEKIGFNNYQFEVKELSAAEPAYISLLNAEEEYHLNIDSMSEEVVVPSSEYVAEIKNMIKEELDPVCVVQLSVKKKIERVSTLIFAQIDEKRGNTTSSRTSVETVAEKYLDSDGIFYTTNSKNTEKIFLMSEFDGQIHIQIVFEDGTEEIKKFPCSENIYHIDQVGS